MSRIVLIFFSVFMIFSSAKEKPPGERCEVCGYKEVTNTDLFRVVNGETIDPKMYPWLVSLANEDADIFCSGALISSQYILTAAHCLGDPEKQKDGCKEDKCLRKASELVVGIWDEKNEDKPHKTMKVSEIITHPDFDGETEDNVLVHDIALLKLTDKIEDCSGDFGPICLMQKNDSLSEDEPLKMAGWGYSTVRGKEDKDEDRTLRKGTLKQVSSERCTHSNAKSKISETIICAVSYSEEEQIPCEGDSGSSIYKKVGDVYYTLGVGSTIFRHKDTKPCTLDAKVLYTKVAYHMKWIKEHVKELPKSEEDTEHDD